MGSSLERVRFKVPYQYQTELGITVMASSSPPLRLHPSKRRKKEQEDVDVAVRSPGKKAPVVVFAHGAGAPSSSEWMVRYISGYNAGRFLLRQSLKHEKDVEQVWFIRCSLN